MGSIVPVNPPDSKLRQFFAVFCVNSALWICTLTELWLTLTHFSSFVATYSLQAQLSVKIAASVVKHHRSLS